MDKNIDYVTITSEMENSFLDYAMSVIVSRALPDVRDGLKPVHRRILYAMNDLGNYSDKPYKKSARIVGDVIGKYHPHGDSSVYDAMVRMAQDFASREMLVDGHGNFGSIDGDGAAAMRYTEARMSKIAMEMLRDIQKNTVDYRLNYDETEQEPVVLPAKFPNLLVNGSSGIAVGMATSIPPHNLVEVINALIHYIDFPECSTDDLLEYIKGPDFPTGATILGRSGFTKAYRTGHSSCMVRSDYEVVELKNGKKRIIISSIPYQVNKARVIEKIAELARDKKVEGITDLRDESDRDGLRIVIETRKDTMTDVLMNNLFKYTQLQSSFSMNMIALVNDEPKVLTLKDFLSEYTKHQFEVITRRTQFDLDKAEARAHILEGLKIALDHIDRVIEIIRNANDEKDAQSKLSIEFSLSEKQTKAITEMRLKRLTGLEREKIEEELKELKVLITDLKDILLNSDRVYTIIKDELTEIREKHGSERRTVVSGEEYSDIEDESLIPEESITITLTQEGYIKRISLDEYKVQRRGGVGVRGMTTNDSDVVSEIISCSTHDQLLFFTNLGKVYQMKGYKIPNYSRTAKGLPIVNLLSLDPEEKVSAIIPVKDFEEDMYFMFVTKHGIGKRVPMNEFSRIYTNGKRAITFKDEADELVTVRKVTEQSTILTATTKGLAIHTRVDQYRSMGRTAAGVRIIQLNKEDYVVSAILTDEDTYVLTISENGYGKQTHISNYKIQNRGGKGLKNLNVTSKNGCVADVRAITESKDLLVITDSGMIIRTRTEQISISGRATIGVKVINIKDDQKVVSTSLVDPSEEESNQIEENKEEQEQEKDKE